MGYLTTAEAADRLKLQQITVRKHIQRGNIKAERYGRDWLISEASLKAFQVNRRSKGRPGNTKPGK